MHLHHLNLNKRLHHTNLVFVLKRKKRNAYFHLIILIRSTSSVRRKTNVTYIAIVQSNINNLDASDGASYSEIVGTILEKIGSDKDTNTLHDINTALGNRL